MGGRICPFLAELGPLHRLGEEGALYVLQPDFGRPRPVVHGEALIVFSTLALPLSKLKQKSVFARGLDDFTDP